MIEAAIILSLKITTVYVLFQQGMLLGGVRIWTANRTDKWFGKRNSKIIQKPIWSCLTCMSGIWTVIFTLGIDIPLIFTVCGLNAIIDKWLDYD